jgi:MscS family membrane protein
MQVLAANPLALHLTIAAIIVVAFALLTRVVRASLQFLGHKIFARTENVLDDRILAVVLAQVKPMMITAGLQLAVREIRKGITADEVTISQILEYAQAILYVLVVIIALRILLGILRELIHWYLDKISADGTSNLKFTLGPLTNKVVDVLVGLVALIIILDHFGINIGSLLVSLGVGSLAVALAAQDTLANMIAGFVILVDRPFRVGDRIEFAPGLVGDVMDIGLRSTRVMGFDNNVVIIPNAELVKSRITNHTYPALPSRVLLKFEIAYGTDTNVIRSILLEIAAAQPELLPEPAPAVFCTALNDSSVQMTFVGRAARYNDQWTVETRMREQAYRIFRERHIEIPFPQRVVHMKSDG